MNRRLVAVLAGLLGVLVLLPTLMAGSVAATAADKGEKKKPSGPSPYSLTKTLQRVFTNADGTSSEFQANTVTVDVDQTKNLRGRQRVLVSWSGAQPSGGRAVNPYGAAGLQQEYPVVVLQCRGTDDGSLPLAQQVRPETCFTSSDLQRSQIARPDGQAPWRNDLDASEAERGRLTGLDPFPSSETCPLANDRTGSTHLTPFIAADGTVYPACDPEHMPPEAAIDAAFPPNEVAAYTGADGSGSVRFEVRSDVENESLGCNDKVACSIVVVPINGLSCAAPGQAPASADPSPTAAVPSDSESPSTPATADPTPPTATPSDEPTSSSSASQTALHSASPSEGTGESQPDPSQWASACRKGGSFEPGSNNFTRQGADLAASPALWWAASNWKNRFSVPITFGLPPDVCDVLDPRAPTGFYGSELLAQAALQWSPAYCLDKKRFKFQLNQMSDEAGFKLMESGIGPAAVVSSKYKRTSEEPVAYAPTAVTGFGIGYNIDLPDNQGEFTNLKLNARLLAKLLFQSYLGSELGRAHPGLANNPVSLQNDPEFKELNPGLSEISTEAGATILSLSNASDVIEQLTAYIAADKDAMDWIKGKPDPWGMVINPSYRKIKMPLDELPLLDTYVPTTDDPCRNANPSPYFSQLAAPVTALRKVSDALLDGWPNVQTKCIVDNAGNLRLGRVDRQNYGTRLMLGIVSLGDQDRFGLRSAALQAAKGKYVAPSPGSLAAAVKMLKASGTNAPLTLNQTRVRRSSTAYPGTMVVYTAAKTGGLDKAVARNVALFIRTSTTEGQVRGSGNGELPGGYLPITKGGATSALYRQAQSVAALVEKQPDTKGEPKGDDDDDADTGTTAGTTSSVSDPPGSVEPPTSDETATTDDSTTDLPASEPVAMPRTTELSSGLASRLLPLLLLVGVLGLGGATGARFFVRPPRGKQ